MMAANTTSSSALPVLLPSGVKQGVNDGPVMSLILATVGRLVELDRIVSSLEAQTDRRFEVILVDQNQDDRLACVAGRLARAGINVRWLRIEQQGLSHARNRGLEIAGGRYVAFPDDDCWYEVDTIKEAIVALGSSEVEVIVGRWVEQNGDLSGKRITQEAARSFRCPTLASITIFARADLVKSLGGFDESLGVTRYFGSSEETDLMFRILSSGGGVEYLPTVRVHHHWAVEPQGGFGPNFRRARVRGRGTGAIYAKHSLSYFVILRGLGGPLFRMVFGTVNAARWGSGVGSFFGRLEGYFAWRMKM
jgi:glycosyltransferase involved in cell wall biosynthesis